MAIVGVGLIAVTRLMGGGGRALTGEEAISAASGVLGVTRAQMQATGEPIRAPNGQVRTSFIVNGEHVAIDALPAPGSFQVEWLDAENAESTTYHPGSESQLPRMGIATAQRLGEAIVARRFPVTGAMRVVIAERLAMGPYMFSWEEFDASGAAVGNGARVFVSADTGRVLSYSERRRPQGTKLPAPQISREAADRIARSVLERRLGKGHVLRLVDDKSGLVLSSAFGRDEGPVWELSYVDETASQTALSRLQLVVIDAVTGKEATRGAAGGGAP